MARRREMLDQMMRAGPFGVSLEEVEQHASGLDFGPLTAGKLPGRLKTKDKMIDLAPEEFVADLARLAAEPDARARDKLRLIGRRQCKESSGCCTR